MVPPNTNTNTIADAYLNRLFQELLKNSMTSFTRIVCHVICNQEMISLIGLESERPRFSTVRYVWGPAFFTGLPAAESPVDLSVSLFSRYSWSRTEHVGGLIAHWRPPEGRMTELS